MMEFDPINKEFIDGENRYSYSLPLPAENSRWFNIDDFELHFLCNPYLNAESNIYEVYEKTNTEGRIGWVFPIQVLSSSDVDERGNLINYLFLGFQKIVIKFQREECRYDNIYSMIDSLSDKNVVILMIHKQTAPNFDISAYQFSLSQYGYYLFLGSVDVKKVENYRIAIDKRLNISLSNIKADENEFFCELWGKQLRIVDSPILRFILLYQIIEFFIGNIRMTEIDGIIKKYTNKEIPINDFTDNINTSKKERNCIKELFNNVDIPHKKNFIEQCKGLFESVNYTPEKKELHDYVYNFRNQLTHSYRNYIDKNCAPIIQEFENVVIDLLIHISKDHKALQTSKN